MNKKNTFNWLDVASRLQAIAQAGLVYGHSEFDRDRYEQLRQISMEIMAHYTTYEEDIIKDLFASDTGYPTPKVDVRAAIFKDGKILMVRERLDGKWSLPGGWADQHLTIKENLVKESVEEAGVNVIPKKLLAVFDRKLHNYPPIAHGCYKIFVECEYTGGGFAANTETTGSGFFGLDELPPLSTERNTMDQIEHCFMARETENNIPFD
ncbi:MAG TPA: NUDIX hydrolase [Bacteroidales bacterium]|nr:NUDIX hydrolase [Bacteroidales bacterium]